VTNKKEAKLLIDCYEFLHLIEIGRDSIRDIVQVFGKKENLPESNLKQVDRLRARCIYLGIDVEFDRDTGKFSAKTGSKMVISKMIDDLKETKEHQKQHLLGPFAARKVYWETPE